MVDMVAMRTRGDGGLSTAGRGSCSDGLSEASVIPLLRTRQFGRGAFVYLASTNSTNDVARAMGEDGAPDGSLVIAETQTHGRGRHRRHWHSPVGGGIYATLLLRPVLPPEHTPLLTLASGIALVEAIASETGIRAAIKWPNDVLVGDRKVAGILTEASMTNGNLDYALVGIGINVNTAPDALPARPRFPAGSLASAGGTAGRIARAPLLAAWLARMEAWIDIIARDALDVLTTRWTACSAMRGRRVSVRNIPGEARGIMHGIAPDGALLLKTPDRGIVRVMTGDLFWESDSEIMGSC